MTVIILTLSACGGMPGGDDLFDKEAASQETSEQDGSSESGESAEENAKADMITIAEPDDLAQVIDRAEQWIDGNDLNVRVYLLPEWEDKIDLAWYLLQDDEPIMKDWYEPETRHTFYGLEPGEYRVKYYLRYEDIIKSFYLNPVTVGATEAESADM